MPKAEVRTVVLKKGHRMRPRGFHPYWEAHRSDWRALVQGAKVPVDLGEYGGSFFEDHPMLEGVSDPSLVKVTKKVLKRAAAREAAEAARVREKVDKRENREGELPPAEADDEDEKENGGEEP